MLTDNYGAWISPKGKVIPVEFACCHDEVAKEITGGLMPDLSAYDFLTSSSYLLASGWLRVVFNKGIKPSFMAQKLTRYQAEWLELYPDNYKNIDCESWSGFQKRSEEDYKFYPIYPFGEDGIKTIVILQT